MLRNLPSRFTRTGLMKLIDEAGFQGRYDFVYLPMDYGHQTTFGYAFLNLVTVPDTISFCAHFEGHTLSDQRLAVAWSEIQGLNENVERYRNSAAMHRSVADCFKPLLLRDGKRLTFPAPTQRLRPPRLSRGRLTAKVPKAEFEDCADASCGWQLGLPAM